MKKILYIIASMALLTVPQGAKARTEFGWGLPAQYNLYKADGTTRMPPTEATVLTYITTDTTVDAIVAGGKLDLRETYNDDYFYMAKQNNNRGYYNTGMMLQNDDSLAGKYIYAIVLDLPFASFTSIADLPKDGSILAAVSVIGSGTVGGAPKPISALPPVAPGESFFGGSERLITNLQVIPEPTGVALMLMGTVVFGVIRRRMMNKV